MEKYISKLLSILAKSGKTCFTFATTSWIIIGFLHFLNNNFRPIISELMLDAGNYFMILSRYVQIHTVFAFLFFFFKRMAIFMRTNHLFKTKLPYYILCSQALVLTGGKQSL